MRPMTTIGTAEPMKAEEAAERLRAFVREIQSLDAQVEEINTKRKSCTLRRKPLASTLRR
jgi:hypothetical protein